MRIGESKSVQHEPDAAAANRQRRTAVYAGSLLAAILAVLLGLPGLCAAAVEGDCSNCHTMHNSQVGTSVAFVRDSTGQQVVQETPFGNLLKSDCLGCHSSPGAETIVNMGDSAVPIVLNFTEPTYPPDGTTSSTLAGGNFYWMINGGDAYGHNVTGISSADSRLTYAPGGVERTGDCINCHGSLATSLGGCEGCHVPHHHAGDGDAVADKADGWYRFLGSVMQRSTAAGITDEGVVGIEDPAWEQNPLPDRHNVYQGDPAAYTNYLETGSISQKCVGCHGTFHSETVADATWIRHPVEVAIPDSGEFTAFTTYDPTAPVARQNVIAGHANFSAIARGSDLVSCISCHRPHGSPYPSMLRWGYRDWPGMDSHTGQPALNGCAICHTSKD